MRYVTLPVFLLLAGALSGCGELCVFLCTDGTNVQQDYVGQRDHCREMAELKAGMTNDTAAINDKQTKTQLVTIFSDCMNGRGWALPGPEDKKDKDKDKAGAVASAGPTQPIAPILSLPAPPPDAAGKRAAECSFARQAANASVTARNRAEACDIECDRMLRMAPDAPRPAACP